MEAALTLPIAILTIASMIMLMVYFFSCLDRQVDLHEGLIKKEGSEVTAIKIIKNKTETSERLGGLVSILMHKEIKGRVYAIRESLLIRTGEILYED